MPLVATIFLSAFLLFQVQLIVAKQLLPWFGGAPSVWATCQFFFQSVLLAGYAYAHWVGRMPSLRSQRRIHLGLLGLGLLAVVTVTVVSGIPIIAPDSLKPSGLEDPVSLLLLILGLTVGAPFLVLSATSPLLQRWHSRQATSLDRTYRLYAVSNAGSLLGLLSYPFAAEWLLTLPTQAWLWGAGFTLFTVTCAAITWRSTASVPAAQISADRVNLEIFPPVTKRSGWADRRTWLWQGLPLLSSALLLATTNQLCQEVATVPFLWVLPLTIYLLTFIICFDRPGLYARRWFLPATAFFTLIVLAAAQMSVSIPISYQIAAHSVLLFSFCMLCHGELAALRPEATQLTLYYLLIAFGGVLGALFISVVAPSIFPDLWDFHVIVLTGWALFAFSPKFSNESPSQSTDRVSVATFFAVAGLILVHKLIGLTALANRKWTLPEFIGVMTIAAMAFGASGAWLSRWPIVRKQMWPRLLTILIVLVSAYFLFLRVQKSHTNALLVARNFFGVIRVQEAKSSLGLPLARMLYHGNITHGLQLSDSRMKSTPTAYFSASSGIGLAARSLVPQNPNDVHAPAQSRHWGIVGMGIGTLAAYAQTGDRVRMYEINPIVVNASEGPDPFFTFLRDCAGETTTVLGDARLALERELSENKSHHFDLLAMDAFSSDAVPVHLITEEAFRLYAAHLKDDRSILAVNITNRFLELEPVIAANAEALGFHGIRIESDGDHPAPHRSSWILLARDSQALKHPLLAAAKPKEFGTRRVIFNDQYSNMFRVLK